MTRSKVFGQAVGVVLCNHATNRSVQAEEKAANARAAAAPKKKLSMREMMKPQQSAAEEARARHTRTLAQGRRTRTTAPPRALPLSSARALVFSNSTPSLVAGLQAKAAQRAALAQRAPRGILRVLLVEPSTTAAGAMSAAIRSSAAEAGADGEQGGTAARRAGGTHLVGRVDGCRYEVADVRAADVIHVCKASLAGSVSREQLGSEELHDHTLSAAVQLLLGVMEEAAGRGGIPASLSPSELKINDMEFVQAFGRHAPAPRPPRARPTPAILRLRDCGCAAQGARAGGAS